jgi:hypothetical protein
MKNMSKLVKETSEIEGQVQISVLEGWSRAASFKKVKGPAKSPAPYLLTH